MSTNRFNPPTRSFLRALPRGSTLLAVMLLAAACGDDPTTPPAEPSELRIESGDQQSGPVAEVLPQPLLVRVVDATGSPLAGVAVSWQVTAGGGSLEASSTSTGADGRAENWWTLGTAAGEQLASAGLTGVENVEFRATAAPGPPHTIVVSPERDTVLVNEARILDARVVDVYGNAIESSSVELSWSSDDSSVAAVSERGIVRALTPGVAQLSVTAEEAGGATDFTVVQIESPPIPTRFVSGAVSLALTLNPETDYVHTLWGGASAVSSDGTFTVAVAADQPSTIWVLRGGDPVGFQIVAPGASVGDTPIDPIETAIGLLYHNPILSSVPPQVTLELLSFLRDQPETGDLARVIEQHLATHGKLLPDQDQQLAIAYRQAMASAMERLLEMGESEVENPAFADGGVQVIDDLGGGMWITAPPRDEVTPEVPLTIENNLQRWVWVWEAATEAFAPRALRVPRLFSRLRTSSLTCSQPPA
jgi:hypothetical protein